MRCPWCGAILPQHSMQCSECGAIQDKESVDLAGQAQLFQTAVVEEPTSTDPKPKAQPGRSLIEFPGVTKSSIPQWRKELGERVREVQERRAREAVLEAGQNDSGVDEGESRTPLLELLPRAEAPPVNPLVAAALLRIERANTHHRFSGNAAVATLMAYEEQSEFGLEVPDSNYRGGGSDVSFSEEEAQQTFTRPEKTHNLAVVPPQVINEEVAPVYDPVDTPEVDETEPSGPILKPRRLILGDLNDPALNYLDSIPVAICVDIAERRSAPILRRLISALLDIVVVCLLSSPVVALVKLTDLKWLDSRVLALGIGTFVVMGFLYLTISTAFTGRTLGMKLLSLRVVDTRTGLIPTGGQSAARALVYMLSLASAGIALIYTFVNPERHAAHDRFTRTVVVRV